VHKHLKARAGPRWVLPHAARRVRLDHGRNISGLQFTLGQFCLSADPIRLNDDKIWMFHSSSTPARFARQRGSRVGTKVTKVAMVGGGASNQLEYCV